MKKKILLVSNTSWYLHNYRLGLALYLKKAGYNVAAAAPYDRFSDKLKDAGIEFINIRRLERKGRNPFKELALLMELHGIYKREKPELIIHFTIKPNLYGSLAARFTGIPSISMITGLGYVFMNSFLLQKCIRPLYRFALAHARKVVFQNEDDMEYFVASRLVESDRALCLRSSGINKDCFSPLRYTKKSVNGKVIFLMSGRLLRDKGIEEFIRGARYVKQRHQNTEFHLLGPVDAGNPSAVTDKDIESWVNEGLIRYFPPVDDVRQHLINCDIFVLPSYREGLPRSILEAMALEKPVITTDTPGCRETTEHGITGLLVPEKDHKALSNAMETMIRIGERGRADMGKKGREKAIREFDEVTIINEYYAKVISLNL